MFEYYYTKKHYHTLDYYLKSKYSKKVSKVSLNASFTCPNRDGSKGTSGCIFCSLNGSGDLAGNSNDDLLTQFDKISLVMENKWKDSYKIAYFQAFSNTYGSIEKLKATFEPFINKKDVIGISIATRPDCINREIVDYLSTLKPHFKEFFVELGLQSANKKTMKLCNLCYTFNDLRKAVKLLNAANIDVVIHIIDGLPFETFEDQMNTIRKLNTLKIQGLKIHVLNILKDTKIASMYLNNEFTPMTMDEYINVVTNQILLLNDNVIIHRLGADSIDKNRLYPPYVKEKLSLMDKIDKKFDELDMYQGDNAN